MQFYNLHGLKSGAWTKNRIGINTYLTFRMSLVEQLEILGKL